MSEVGDVAEPNGTVSYTVKELLARQDGKLDTIILTLASKADRSDLDKIEGRVGSLETITAQQQGSSGLTRWVVPVAVSVVAAAMSLYAILQQAGL